MKQWFVLFFVFVVGFMTGCEQPPPDLPICGDGILEEPREECDDGNEEDGDDCMIPLSDEILDSLGWYEGDILEWIVNDDNTITIKKAS